MVSDKDVSYLIFLAEKKTPIHGAHHPVTPGAPSTLRHGLDFSRGGEREEDQRRLTDKVQTRASAAGVK